MSGTWPWILFNVFILLMLAIDLGIFHRQSKKVSFKEAITWSVVRITLALIFNGWIYYSMGEKPAVEFLTGYLVEKSLSVDNIFVFVLLVFLNSDSDFTRLYCYHNYFIGDVGKDFSKKD